MSRIIPCWPVCVCVLVLFFSGCSDSGLPAVYPVEGKVTGGNASLEGVRISFVAVEKNGSGATGVISSDGSYKLEALDGRPGCPVGKYKVVLTQKMEDIQKAMMDLQKVTTKPAAGPTRPGAPKAPTSPTFAAPFPDAYRDAEKSPKTVEVKAESNKIDVTL